MKSKILFIIALQLISGAAMAVVLDDFESYTDTTALTSVWHERNTNATITLSPADGIGSSKALNYEFWCGTDPWWTEAYTIFPADQDWTSYDTLNIYLKGVLLQPREDMFCTLYSAKTANPTSHTDLSQLGKTFFFNATQDPNWPLWEANINYNFGKLDKVRAVGIGMSPQSFGHGTILMDKLELVKSQTGGVIDGFDIYADSNAVRAARRVKGNATISIESNEVNVFKGTKSLKVDYYNNASPYYASVEFKTNKFSKSWRKGTTARYNPLTIHFKAAAAEGFIRATLVDEGGLAIHSFDYNNGARIPVGQWVTWNIDPSVLITDNDPFLIDAVSRVDIVFRPIDYGHGVVYLDEISLHACGSGPDEYGLGGITGDFNGDCVVDFADYASFASHWFQSSCSSSNNYCGGTDFSIGGSRDGTVNFKDLNVMAYNWLECNMLYKGDCF
jgi:hypothetical protein